MKKIVSLFSLLATSGLRPVALLLVGVWMLIGGATLGAFVPPAEAQTARAFGSVNVGSSTTATMNVTVLNAGTLGNISVLTQGASGLDFTNAGGGTCATGTTYAANATCTVNVTFTPKFAGTRYGGVVLTGTSNNVLATGYVHGTGTGPQVTFANTTQANYAPSIQTTLGGGFFDPTGVAMDGNGDIFVADYGNNAVREIVAAGGYALVKTLGSGFSHPSSVAVDGSGNVFVADEANSAVKEIVAAGGYTTVNTLSGGFYNPYGVAVDGAGNIFVADTYNHAVKEVIAIGGYTTVNTLGSGFISPWSVAVDGSGNVYVADHDAHAVMAIVAVNGSVPANPTINTLGGNTFEYTYPTGVAVDGMGNVFVASQGEGTGSPATAKEIAAAGGYTTVNTLGSGFILAGGIAVDASGDVYVTDRNSTTVTKLDFVDPPSLAFASTQISSTSSDSPQTVTVENIGNATLSFPIPSTGNNPSIAANFTLNSSGTTACPLVTANSSTAGTLAAGASCLLPISFKPTTGGTLGGSLVLTDNNLNSSAPGYATESIALSGIAKTTPMVTVTPSSSNITTLETISVTVTVNGETGYPTPTGSVTVTGGGYTSPTTNLNGGSATITIYAGSLALV
jgi:hypothetical protein